MKKAICFFLVLALTLLGGLAMAADGSGTDTVWGAVSLEAASPGTLRYTWETLPAGAVTRVERILDGSGGAGIDLPATQYNIRTDTLVSHTMAIRARDSNGTQVGTDSMELTYAPPTAPTLTAADVTVTNPVPGSLRVNFPAESEQGSATIYEYAFRVQGNANWSTRRWSATMDTYYNLTGLTNGQAYTIEMKVTNRAGLESNVITLQGTPAGTPSAPKNLVATPGDRQITLTWDPSDANGSIIAGYEVRLGGSGLWTPADTDASHTFTGLTNGTEYTLTVLVKSTTGRTATADTTATPVQGQGATRPGDPTAVAATVSGTNVTLTWDVPASDGGSPVTSYEVQLDGGAWSLKSVTDRSHEFYSLASGAHDVAVRAVNANGASAGVTKTVTIGATPGAPDVPTGVDATAGGQDITLVWGPPHSDGGSPVTGYEVQLDGGGWLAKAATDRSHTFPGLADGSHTVSVRALNANGASAGVAKTVTLGTPGPIADRPALQAALQANGTVALTWQAPASTGPVTGYRIYRDGVLLGEVAATQTYYEDAFQGSEATYTLTYLTAGGESAPSQPRRAELTQTGSTRITETTSYREEAGFDGARIVGASGSVNVYDTPGGEAIGKARAGEAIQVVQWDREGKWCRIMYSDGTRAGWVLGTYVGN